jgi:Arabinose efflux permease
MTSVSPIWRLIRRPQSPLRGFSNDYWLFFLAAFCMDLGFGLFFFLFNLYLADLHFDEQFIGRVMACFTMGNVAGTVPAIIFVRRHGIRPLLIGTFLCAPVLCAARLFAVNGPAQLALAVAAGGALCGWPICFSPAIAKLTNDDNRSLGFSLAFATGIGLGTVAGFTGGYIPQLLHSAIRAVTIVDGIRIVLLTSCTIVLIGVLPLAAIQLEHRTPSNGQRMRTIRPVLIRFLPGFILWSAVMGSFAMFGALYLQNKLGIPLGKLGIIFSASQLMQFVAVLLAPLLFRRVRIHKGIAVIQLGAGALLMLIAASTYASVGIVFYILYFGVQYMCEPGIYAMLMESVPEAERSTASAIQNFSSAICQACTTAFTGHCIVRFGYELVLMTNAVAAMAAALIFMSMGRSSEMSVVPLDQDAAEIP